MKTIGILGGMSWQSSSVYYRLINEGIGDHLGGLHSAKIILYSLEFNELASLQHQGNWQQAGELLIRAAHCIEKAGADGILIATNTMHKVADRIAAQISIPLLHIADSTGRAIVSASYEKVGLLATAFTMEQEFYKGHISNHYGIDIIVPEQAERTAVHNVIYNELCRGIVKASSRDTYVEIINSLKSKGAQAVILGCTEIDLLIAEKDVILPLFDSTALHAKEAVEWMLSD